MVPLAASAFSPTRPEFLLCTSSHVLQARVKYADSTPTGCAEGFGTCCSTELVVTVTNVVAIAKAAANYPKDLGISTGKDVRLTVHQQLDVQTPTRNKCVEEQSSLLGKEFLFFVYEHKTDLTPPNIWYSALIWYYPKWVDQMLQAADPVGPGICPVRDVVFPYSRSLRSRAP